MIKKYLKVAALPVILILIMSFSDKEITCVIKGKVIGRNSDKIILFKGTDLTRLQPAAGVEPIQIVISIKDSIFEYKLTIPQTEAYILMFEDEYRKGVSHPIYLFPEKGEINMRLHSFDNYKNNQIIGGDLNSKYEDYERTVEENFNLKQQLLIDSIFKIKKEYSNNMFSLKPDMQNVMHSDTINDSDSKLNDNRSTLLSNLSEKEGILMEKVDSISHERTKFRYNYIKQNPSLIGYYFMFEDLTFKRNIINNNDLRIIYTTYSKKYPNHPYTLLINDMITARENIKIGSEFIDFSASDLHGKTYILSDIIKDKIALIDLWASYCGPCIMKSKSMIPVYKEFKNRGFTICGVASEIKNTDRMEKIIEREKFPWINLVELDYKNKIWAKYGVTNSAGATFLIDKDGKILAINPTAEEVRNILIDKLK
jgi:peroxiredoxin